MTWLDVMPVIPLARGVPVVELVEGTTRVFGRGIVVDDGSWSSLLMVLWDDEREPELTDGRVVRVDLIDPLGFGHALRWWVQNADPDSFVYSEDSDPDLYEATVGGWTTEADRIALAKACTEVQDG